MQMQREGHQWIGNQVFRLTEEEKKMKKKLSEGITSVLSALGFLNPGLHLMQTLFIFFKP